MSSTYPRPGHPIIPGVLREFVPERLRTLDATAWKRFDAGECRRMAEEALVHVKSVLALIRARAGGELLPQPPEGVRLYDLDLEIRTHNCLARAGFADGVYGLGTWTLRRVMALPNFGARCLLDLLTSLEHAVSSPELNESLRANPEGDFTEGEEVDAATVEELRRLLKEGRGVPIRLRQKKLPRLQPGLRLDKLELSVRTYNCLRERGQLDHPEALSGTTIGDLLLIPNFGKDSLVNLLTLLEPFFVNAVTEGPHTAAASPGGHWRADEQMRLLRFPGEAEQTAFFSSAAVAATHTQGEVGEEIAAEARELERVPGAHLIRHDDLRLGRTLRSIDPLALSAREAAERLIRSEHTPTRPEQFLRQLREFRRRVCELSTLKLEDELLNLLVGVKNARNREIVARRMGLDGREGSTLQEIGETFGVTRERIRQICKRVTEALKGRYPFAPVLDRTLDLVARHLPDDAESLELKIVEAGLARSAFRLESLASSARLLGRTVPFVLTEVSGKRVAIAPEAEIAAGGVLKVARRAVEHWGAATIEDVAARAAEASSLPATVVRRILIARPDFRWLDEEAGWFWLQSVPRNRLLNQIEKILSVAGRIDVAELRGGVGRHYRTKGFAPPQRVILELCRQTPWCIVDGRTVVAGPDLDWGKVLHGTERTMVHILKGRGQIMQRERLEEACLGAGMKRVTFYVCIDNSPVIAKYARGVYGLRGADVPPGLVETLIPTYRKNKVMLDYGWTPEGKIWCGYKLSESTIEGGACSVPTALKQFLLGEFILKTLDGARLGRATVNGSSIWGLRELFRRRGGEAGDYMVLEFDLAKREVAARVAEENLIEDFQSDEKTSSPLANSGSA